MDNTRGISMEEAAVVTDSGGGGGGPYGRGNELYPHSLEGLNSKAASVM